MSLNCSCVFLMTKLSLLNYKTVVIEERMTQSCAERPIFAEKKKRKDTYGVGRQSKVAGVSKESLR